MHGNLYLFLAPDTRRVHNRWLVAYTLLRNPSLQELRASRIKEKREMKDSGEDQGISLKQMVESDSAGAISYAYYDGNDL